MSKSKVKKSKSTKKSKTDLRLIQQKNLAQQLTPQEYDALSGALDDFQESFLSFLAGTAQYEIVPTTDEYGEPISDKNLELIRRECKRLGFKVLYSMDLGKQVLITNPDTMKTGILTSVVEVH